MPEIRRFYEIVRELGLKLRGCEPARRRRHGICRNAAPDLAHDSIYEYGRPQLAPAKLLTE